MADRKLECTKVNTCKWRGLESELKKVESQKLTKQYGVKTWENLCPRCGRDEFYYDENNQAN